MKPVSIDSAPHFQLSQIICLEHQNTCLYAEVIDVVQARQQCWGRPIMLAVWAPGTHLSTAQLFPEPQTLYDLRQGADILLPISLFRLALDIELIPLLANLDAATEHSPPDAPTIAHRQLKAFVHQVWLSNPAAFQLISEV